MRSKGEHTSPLGVGWGSPVHPVDLDILIVGAGSAGFGTADRWREIGLDYVVIEQQRPAQLIRNYTKGKPLSSRASDLGRNGARRERERIVDRSCGLECHES